MEWSVTHRVSVMGNELRLSDPTHPNAAPGLVLHSNSNLPALLVTALNPAQQLIDTGFRARFGIHLFHDDCTIEAVFAVRGR